MRTENGAGPSFPASPYPTFAPPSRSPSESTPPPVRLGQASAIREADQIVPDASDRVAVAFRRMNEVEQVEMADWGSGWLAGGSMGDPVAGYARLAEGPLGQVIASFTLLLGEGFGSSGYSPATERFLRYD